MMRAAFVCALVGSACGPRLRAGMGGLRVHLTGARDQLRSTVAVRTRYQDSSHAIERETTSKEALFLDLAPDFYEVVAYHADGRGGFYRTWTGNGRVRVEAGRVTDIDVQLAGGLAVTGLVLDTETSQPLDHVDIQPPPHLASTTWPSTMPGLWAETRPDGTFAIGGIEPLVPVPPGAAPGPRERAWLKFTREGYLSQTIPLDAPDSGSRHLQVRLSRGSAPNR